MLELNKIYNGDCLELMKDIPDGSINMVLCDLPYGTTENRWDVIIPFDQLWSHYERLITNEGAIVLTASQPFTSVLAVSNLKLFKYAWIWKKSCPTSFLNAKNAPMKLHEDILVFSKNMIANGSDRMMNYFPQGLVPYGKTIKAQDFGLNWGIRKNRKPEYTQEFTNYPNSVLEFASENNTIHPTQKPVPLFEYLIKTYTKEGETVLDNTAGSCTTAIAAINTNRQFICMEKNKNYFDLAFKRVEDHLITKHELERQETLF